MRDISANRFLLQYSSSMNDMSLNAFLFSDYVEEKCTSVGEMLFSVRNMLSAFGFKFQLVGFSLLARAVMFYLVKPDYDESKTLKILSEYYGLTVGQVVADIETCVDENRGYSKAATRRLGVEVAFTPQNKITTTIESVAALFKIYYNLSVPEDADLTDGIKIINFGKVDWYGAR